MQMTYESMMIFAETWIAAWNRRDVEGVLAHFAEEAQFGLRCGARPRKTGVGDRQCRNGNLQTKRRLSPTPSGTTSHTNMSTRPPSPSGNGCYRRSSTRLWRCAPLVA
jgi:hypothetical protein